MRYADAGGTTRGVAVYRLSEEGEDFTKHDLELHYLVTETADAYAALWRFVLEHDLVAVVKASLRSVDEPLRWMIADQRGASVKSTEHGWLRILDVPTVLGARAYASSGAFTLRVTDPLGFADGTWRLSIDDTGGAVIDSSDRPADITLSVYALSSLLLGGNRAPTLAHAGLIDAEPAVLSAFEAAFRSAETPYLSLWY